MLQPCFSNVNSQIIAACRTSLILSKSRHISVFWLEMHTWDRQTISRATMKPMTTEQAKLNVTTTHDGGHHCWVSPLYRICRATIHLIMIIIKFIQFHIVVTTDDLMDSWNISKLYFATNATVCQLLWPLLLPSSLLLLWDEPTATMETDVLQLQVQSLPAELR